MKITVAGAGYVGLVTSVCLAELGHQVTCIDIQKEKIDMLQKGMVPIFEPGVQPLLQKMLRNGELQFTLNPEQAYSDAEIIYIAVGTPETEDGNVDLKYIHIVSHTIAYHIKNDVIICTKSTVPVGTNDLIKEIIQSRIPGNLNVKVVANPEFLREGSAVYDFYNGDRIVIGTDDDEAASILEKIYLPLKIPITKTDIRSAEMIKYASNAFLAVKISFINEIANLCEKVGANIEEVANGIGQDKRIGHSFLKAGIGFGGSCFPKDIKALAQLAGDADYAFELLEAVLKVNIGQRTQPVTKAKGILGTLKYKKVALLGLAFKPDTDDVREAPSLSIARELLEEGAFVTAYDPVAISTAKHILANSITYTPSIQVALKDADLAIIATDWDQIKHTSPKVYVSCMKEPIIIDGRNCYALKDIEPYPITYISIGRPAIIKLYSNEQ